MMKEINKRKHCKYQIDHAHDDEDDSLDHDHDIPIERTGRPAQVAR